MSTRPRVFIVDDQPGDIEWLFERIDERGYDTVLATNEEDARKRFVAVRDGHESYVAAIVDVMVPVKDLEDLIELDDEFFENSQDTGIRLCRYARQDLGLSAETLPIASLTVRDDDEVRTAMAELDIPLYDRAWNSPTGSIDRFIERHLPARS